jgi:hypothetical protein
MPGEPRKVFRRIVRTEIVEEEEGVEERSFLVSERPLEVDARSFDRRPGPPHFPDGSEDRHRQTSMAPPNAPAAAGIASNARLRAPQGI